MTVIASAISKSGRIFMGGDGVATQDDSVRVGVNPKVFQRGAFLIGSTGTVRVCQIIEHVFNPPRHESGVSVESYMVGKFVKALRKAMQDHGGEVESNGNGKIMNGRCLVGYRGRLFEIDSAYGVFMPSLPYHAVGCAEQVALGAMYALKNANPEETIKAALEASAEFDCNIRPPFTIKSIPEKLSK
jgi:ATP-dependent protease HslVU (ClpYQ) peptidase subunit